MTGDIVFLCHRIPFPPDRGDKIRSFHLLRALADIAPVHVGCFADDARDRSFAADMAKISASQCVLPRRKSRALAGIMGLLRRQPMLVALYDHPALHRWVAQVMAERPIAAIVAYSAQMAHFVPLALPDTRFMMDFVDFDSAKYAAYGAAGSGPMGWINRREGRLLYDFERAVAARADIGTFVSEAEAAMFRMATGETPDRIIALENGVALDYFDSAADFAPVDAGQGPLFAFTGQMDYRPNIEAVDSFARHTLPLIRARRPDARFAIVGRNPAKQVEALAQLPGVIVTGAVPDIRGWLAAADAVVAPLRIARGIQNKVLEAMAMARPVIASPQAAEGIDARHDTHLLIAANPADEAALCLALLDDPDWAHRLGQAARAHMEARYRWSATLAALPGLLFPSSDKRGNKAA